MKPTADYLSQAQAVIKDVLDAYRPQLMAAFGNVASETKSDNSPVTKLDKELEQLLRKALKKFDASVGLQGEEDKPEGNPNTFWLIDPIDGTEYFIRGIPVVLNLITLIDNGEPVYAMINNFISENMFVSAKGQGAKCDGQPIHVSDRPKQNAITNLSVDLGRADVLPVVSALRKQVRSARVFDDITFVPSGKFDAHLIINNHGGPWDYAPIALMIQEAGGKVANLGADSYNYLDMNLFCANPVIFDDLFKTINTAAKQSGLIE